MIAPPQEKSDIRYLAIVPRPMTSRRRAKWLEWVHAAAGFEPANTKSLKA
jgi:hypothetical protein